MAVVLEAVAEVEVQAPGVQVAAQEVVVEVQAPEAVAEDLFYQKLAQVQNNRLPEVT